MLHKAPKCNIPLGRRAEKQISERQQTCQRRSVHPQHKMQQKTMGRWRHSFIVFALWSKGVWGVWGGCGTSRDTMQPANVSQAKSEVAGVQAGSRTEIRGNAAYA